MGTGLLARINKNKNMDWLVSKGSDIKRVFGLLPPLEVPPPAPAGPPPMAPDDAFLNIRDDFGILRSVSHLTDMEKLVLSNRRNYLVRAELALDVASAYPGGDYLEFGSSGLATFRNFLAAFAIYYPGHTRHYPDTKFYAFDIFGDPDSGTGAPRGEQGYFEQWRQSFEMAAPLHTLEAYGDLKDRCVIVPGYFQDTLSEELKAERRAANRNIGFAFLDVNTGSSYKLVFDWLIDVITPDQKMFIYLDEYFLDAPVPVLYDIFCEEAKKRYNLRSIYVRNAGNFGALFCLMPPPIAEYDPLFPFPIRRV